MPDEPQQGEPERGTFTMATHKFPRTFNGFTYDEQPHVLRRSVAGREVLVVAVRFTPVVPDNPARWHAEVFVAGGSIQCCTGSHLAALLVHATSVGYTEALRRAEEEAA